MNLKLQLQQALELYGFTSQPSKEFGTVENARKAYRVSEAIFPEVEAYRQLFKDLQEEYQGYGKKLQEEHLAWLGSKDDKGQSPSMEEQQKRNTEGMEKLQALGKEAEDKDAELQKTEGTKEVTIKVDANDLTAVKKFFNSHGAQYPMWQEAKRLDAMASFFEQN